MDRTEKLVSKIFVGLAGVVCAATVVVANVDFAGTEEHDANVLGATYVNVKSFSNPSINLNKVKMGTVNAPVSFSTNVEIRENIGEQLDEDIADDIPEIDVDINPGDDLGVVDDGAAVFVNPDAIPEEEMEELNEQLQDMEDLGVDVIVNE